MPEGAPLSGGRQGAESALTLCRRRGGKVEAVASARWIYDPVAESGPCDFEYRYREVPDGAVLQWYDDATFGWTEIGRFDDLGSVLEEVRARRSRRRVAQVRGRYASGADLRVGGSVMTLDGPGEIPGPLACFQREAPWDREGTLYFYGGAFSNFAETVGLELPEGWYGHPVRGAWIEVPSVEHYFQACKACSEEDFAWVMEAPTAARAKRRGGPRGEGGRRIVLRPDWEDVKVEVMRYACRGKFAREGFRELLLGTGDRSLVEDSPSDYTWGGRDRRGGYEGKNLLGIVLMEVRAGLDSCA